jgi:uncharacterized membrane protein YqhA
VALRRLETLFEGALWSSRLVVLAAVIASLAASLGMFYVATVDTFYMVSHLVHYADGSMTSLARKAMHDETIGHVVEIVDGYLLATVMLIFSLGLYELFISKIDQAAESEGSSSVLLIRSLDDLKARLAKVILMILIVTFFERVLGIKFSGPLDLLYLAGGIALIGLALYLTHAGETGGKKGH